MTPAIRGVVVAIPANDEEALLPACLDSVAVAVRRLHDARPGTACVIAVAADACTDRTAQLARDRGALVVELTAHRVGDSRDAAVRAGLDALGLPPAQVWIANTDADSLVPPHWLTHQVRCAEDGVVLVQGTVEPVGPIDPDLLVEWHARHDLREGGEQLHGANLGVLAQQWAAHGGFGPVAVHEDAGLAWRIRTDGGAFVATDRHRVRTSARVDNRVPGGFGGYLRRLAAGTVPLPPDPAPPAAAEG